MRPQFVGWRADIKPDGKLDKIPLIANTTRPASTADLMAWDWFEKAYEGYENGTHDGIGFVFCSADPFVGLDFDNCRNPETGEVDSDVLEYIECYENRYVEVSPSGTGVHLITLGKIRGGFKKGVREVYDRGRFFTLTGVRCA